MGGGQPLGPVALRERDEVGDLLPLQVNDLHQLARPGGKGRAVPARNQDLPPHMIRPRRFGRWPRRAVCLPGPHGSFIAHGEDCASYTILGSSQSAQCTVKRLTVIVTMIIVSSRAPRRRTADTGGGSAGRRTRRRKPFPHHGLSPAE